MQLANQEHPVKRDRKVLKVREVSQAKEVKGAQLEPLVLTAGQDCPDYRENGVHEVQLANLVSEVHQAWQAYLELMDSQVNVVFPDSLA